MPRTTGEWQALVRDSIAAGQSEIAADIAAGRVPATVATFAELHDYVDANEYGGLCDPGWIEDDRDGTMSQITFEMSTRVQDALDRWLKGGRR